MKGTAVMRWVAGVATVVLAVVAGASTASGAQQAGFTLHIGVVVPFTGASAVFGPAYAKTAGLAVQQAKAALKQAGVNDVKIEIEYADDGTTPEGGVNAARKMISKGANCILGALTSGSSIAIAQAATVPARVPQIGPNNSSPALTDLKDDGYYFRTMPSDTLQAPILARLIKEELGAGKTISLAGRNDAFGTGLLPILKTALEKIGMKTQGPLLYDPTAASYNSEADDIVKGNPDAYVILDFPANYAKIGSALLRTGRFNGRKLFVAGGWPSTIPSFIPTASLEGARGTVAGSRTGTKAAEAFDKLFASKPGTEGPPDARLEQLRRGDGLHPRCGGGELGEGLGDRQADPARRVRPGSDVYLPQPGGRNPGDQGRQGHQLRRRRRAGRLRPERRPQGRFVQRVHVQGRQAGCPTTAEDP